MSDIVVYSSPNCGRCEALKAALKRAKVEFTEKSLDTEVLAELAMKNIFSLPVIEIDGMLFEFKGNMKT